MNFTRIISFIVTKNSISHYKHYKHNPKLLSDNGWCYLKDYPEKWEAKARGKPWTRKAWGFCSSSCNTQIQVIYVFLSICRNL